MEATMPPSERKIKQDLLFKDVPAFLRHLADAVEGKTDNLPAPLANLPMPITKLAVKGKARNNAWEIKIKVAAEPRTGPAPKNPRTSGGAETPSTAYQPGIDYKQLKQALKASFKSIGISLASQKLPEPEVVGAFLTHSERMMTFTGRAYGEPHFPIYRKICQRLAEAYAVENLVAFQAAYVDLKQLKSDCHNAYK
jgi:XXXCH domain-containing protein